MSHLDHLTSLIDLNNLSVVDVGAGDGKFARAFARRGARVIGVEIDDAKVAIARKAEHPDVEIRLGLGEDLPVDDGGADLVCFMFSFHHVPDEVQERALLEAHRVLKPEGRLHLVEPRPYGPMAEVMRDIADETHVLTCSKARLDRLAAEEGLFSRLSTTDYAISLKTPDFETFVNGIIAVDPRRAEKLPAARAGMEAAFRERAEAIEDGFRLEQPCIAHHFERID